MMAWKDTSVVTKWWILNNMCRIQRSTEKTMIQGSENLCKVTYSAFPLAFERSGKLLLRLRKGLRIALALALALSLPIEHLLLKYNAVNTRLEECRD